MSKKLTKVTCQNCYGNLGSESEYDAVRCPCGSVVAQYRHDDPEAEWIAYKGRMLEAVRVGGWRFVKGITAAEAIDGLADALEKATAHYPDPIQQRALETWHSKDKDFFLQLNHAVLQLASEGGEVAALWAKFNYKPAFKLREGMTREETFKANLLDELGDVLYYTSILAHLYGWTIEDISQYNYEKLRGGHGWKAPQ